VLACISLLGFGIPAKAFGTWDASATGLLRNILNCVIVFSLFSLPFDLTGLMIERHYQRSSETMLSYLWRWCKASVKHGWLFVAMVLAITSTFHACGILGLVGCSIAFSFLLIWKQTELARLYSGVCFDDLPQELRDSFPRNREGAVPIIIARSQERCLSGGIVGLPGAEAIVIPQMWLNNFSRETLWAEVTRRNSIIASGGRTRGVMLAILFTLVGILAAALATTSLFHLQIDQTAGIVTMSLSFTIWSFLGLLLMPYPSQLGVFEADRLALAKGVRKDLLVQTIGMIDKDLEDEPSRSRSVETIFHPIPTVENRIKALEDERDITRGGWHAARYAVMLSVVGLGLLGRAVHCNAGKPELWAMLPAD
jgi:hypothetical protein